MSINSTIGWVLYILHVYTVYCFTPKCLHVVLFVIGQSLLADEQLASCPVLLLGNKIDIPGAASEDYIRQYFGLYGLTTGKVRLVWLFKTSFPVL